MAHGSINERRDSKERAGLRNDAIQLQMEEGRQLNSGCIRAEVGCHVWHSLHVFILNSVERESEIEVISSTSHE